VLVPVLIFLAGLSAGVLASARWLPDLAPGQVGGLAFFFVCGLIGAAVGLAGVDIYSIVQELNVRPLLGGGVGQGVLVASGIRGLVFEVGSLLGLAGIVYLLAPPAEIDDAAEAEPAI
jgi:hypothetical protein